MKVRHYEIKGFVEELRHWGARGLVAKSILRVAQVSQRGIIGNTIEIRASFAVDGACGFPVAFSTTAGADWPDRERSEAETRAEKLTLELRAAAAELGLDVLGGEVFAAQERV